MVKPTKAKYILKRKNSLKVTNRFGLPDTLYLSIAAANGHWKGRDSTDNITKWWLKKKRTDPFMLGLYQENQQGFYEALNTLNSRWPTPARIPVPKINTLLQDTVKPTPTKSEPCDRALRLGLRYQYTCVGCGKNLSAKAVYFFTTSLRTPICYPCKPNKKYY